MAIKALNLGKIPAASMITATMVNTRFATTFVVQIRPTFWLYGYVGSPPMQAQPADFAEGERRLCRGCVKQETDNKERGYVSGAAGQVARIEGDSCGGGNCLNLTFCVLAKEDSPATREQGPNSDVEDALSMGWEKISPGEERFCWVRG